MPDDRHPREGEVADARDTQRARQRLVQQVRASLRAADVYARVLSDRFELACTTDPHLLDGVPADLLPHLIAASDAFQDGARHALWHIEPELARNARVIADLARESAGVSSAESR
ncbi:MAG TPA: hypothetical protein VFF79_10175 [Conexibacter sp.]|jgi:hypothetical protein|nr:hypothetical protein [Conexibacter sp.]